MWLSKRIGLVLLCALSLVASAAVVTTLTPQTPLVLDLAQPFATRSPWRFTATQAPDVPDPLGLAEPPDLVPGPIRLCLSRNAGRTCEPDLDQLLGPPEDHDDFFTVPHYLNDARLVTPRPGRRLLLLQVASTHSINGNQRVASVALAYDARRDRFVTVYREGTGRNNNEEIRYLDAGPLRGDFVFAEPTGDAPFGFWVTVSAPGAAPTDPYHPVLRYRSATRYNDGNPLAVIDSEMPSIQRRLGAWHPGQPLPRPTHGACANPHLVRGALWC